MLGIIGRSFGLQGGSSNYLLKYGSYRIYLIEILFDGSIISIFSKSNIALSSSTFLFFK